MSPPLVASQGFHIGSRAVGPGQPPFIVAEVAQAHDGSLGSAHAYIDAVARAGADAIKFQTHIARAETTAREPWRIKFSPQDATRFDYWKRMEFKENEWAGLAAHAVEKGLSFMATPFSFEAVDLLERIGVPAWKIGGAEVANLALIRRAARTKRPVIISSGMATWAELDRAIAAIREEGAQPAVLQCSSVYPCPPEKWGLNVIGEMRARYQCPVGFSDHSATVFAGLAAAALGANIIEVHVAFSREVFGPDTSSSLTTSEIAELVRGTRAIATSLGHPIDKDAMSSELSNLRKIFGRSIVAARDLPAGQVIAESDVAFKKPGDGLPPDRLPEVVGRRLKRALAADDALKEDDLG